MINWELDYKVIDMHTHMGASNILYSPYRTADSMVEAMDDCNIEFVVCNHFEDLHGTGGHVKITEAMNKYPDRFKGYYCANPQLPFDRDAIHKAFQENPGFVGFKLGPDYHRTPLTHPDYAPIMELADDCKMLVLCHTFADATSGYCCNDAKEVEGVVSRYPNIRFLMGHSIQGQTDWAIEIAKKYPNAYLELCDTCRLNGMVEKMARSSGAEKMVYGTDAPLQTHNFQMGCVIGARISDEEKKLILRDNALRLLATTGRP